MIIHGDNLLALKSLLPQYEGLIDCIYIDPPYNTGNEKWVYNDNVNDPKIKKWLGQVVGAEGEDLSRHDKWLCMIYPRLLLDTGKRNNLINFKDAKMGTVEIVSPDFDTLFSKAEHSATFEVYDPKLDDEEDDEENEVVEETETPKDEQEDDAREKRISKEDYMEMYEHRLKKSGQVLIYNSFVNPIKIVLLLLGFCKENELFYRKNPQEKFPRSYCKIRFYHIKR